MWPGIRPATGMVAYLTQPFWISFVASSLTVLRARTAGRNPTMTTVSARRG